MTIDPIVAGKVEMLARVLQAARDSLCFRYARIWPTNTFGSSFLMASCEIPECPTHAHCNGVIDVLNRIWPYLSNEEYAALRARDPIAGGTDTS